MCMLWYLLVPFIKCFYTEMPDDGPFEDQNM